jgi:HAD superfamily hydrolase (TIGR01509 family)
MNCNRSVGSGCCHQSPPLLALRFNNDDPGMKRLIIFDFDGVIADSEVLANTVLAEVVSELGVPTTLDDALRRYMGKRFHEVIASIEAAVGRSLPRHFSDDFQRRTLSRFRSDLRIVEGAREFIEAFPEIPRCIASSSSSDRLALCLDVLDITNFFGSNVYSASGVDRGKPHPDIFLHVANTMAVDPARCIVIEDSVSGVQAGIAAGMTVVGLLAASHVRAGHAERLHEAGAHYLARTFKEAQEVTRGLISS